jgi:exosortase
MGMSVPATKSLWRAFAITATVIFAYASVLAKLSRDWWTDENYSHGLLIPFVIGYILWIQRDKLSKETARPATLLGIGTVIVALLALWAGVAGAELYTQRLSLILLIVGTVVYFFGIRFVRLLVVPLVLLLLAIPIPAILFNKIAFPLQLFASRCAVWSMGVLGIPVLRQGNIIELKPLNSFQTKKLEVVEACSGIRSLMTLVTLAVVFAYFTYPDEQNGSGSKGPWAWLKSYGFWRTAILVVSAVPIAILTNAMRVSGTGVLAHFYGTQVADGFFHSFSGWAIYIVAFLMLFGVGWILDKLRPRRTEIRANEDFADEAAAATGQVVSMEGTE